MNNGTKYAYEPSNPQPYFAPRWGGYFTYQQFFAPMER